MPYWDDDESIDFDCIDNVEAIAETEKALLCRWEDVEHWIPKSVIGDDSEVYKDGHTGKLFVAVWFAENEGL